ncbi:nitroreductase [Nocardia sp. NPDC057668]|uniref:nitroreductase n=1 Tax=Nocardia sp. NPDC057668 TaxID=3346202 RepID=UPI00366D9107
MANPIDSHQVTAENERAAPGSDSAAGSPFAAEQAPAVASTERPHDTTGPAPYQVLRSLLDDRHTCRAFRPDPVSRETITQILTTAQRTPSGCNAQPWQVIVTEPPATARLRESLLAHIDGAAPATDIPFPTYHGVYRDRRRECAAALYAAVDVPRGDHAGTMRQLVRNFEFFDAPHLALITTDTAQGSYGVLDCGLYLTSFLLTAQSLGVATAPQAALATYSPFLHEYFAIPEDRQIVAGISFGYGDPNHPANGFRTTRADLGDVVKWHSN